MTIIQCALLALTTFVVSGIAESQTVGHLWVAQELNPKRERRAIRGCDVPSPCHDDLLTYQDEFDAKTRVTAERRKTTVRTPHPANRVLRPSTIRPDQPWLDGLRLPSMKFTWDARIIDYLLFYKNDPKGQSIISSWLRAKDVYRDLIESEIRNQGLPAELSNLAMIESSFDPNNISRTGASGLWQFMPASGKIYGLKQNQWIDERNDPLLSTRAALRFLKDLYERFGNWELSLAAYNAGFGAVLRGVSRYNTNHFWRLLSYENALPWESSNYVAKFLAVSIVDKNQGLFNISNKRPKKPLSYTRVSVPKGTPIQTIAEWCDIDAKTIKRLNPQILGKRTPPSSHPVNLYIPKSSTNRYRLALKNNSESSLKQNELHVVKHGESMQSIADKHGSTKKELLRMNQLASSRQMRSGQTLILPNEAKQNPTENKSPSPNKMKSAPVVQLTKITVAVPEPTFKVSGRKRFFYKVVSGDSQFKIAKQFNVDRMWMARWNGLDPEAFLHPNMVLVVWADKRFDPSQRNIETLDPKQIELIKTGSKAHLDRIEEKNGRKRVLFKAKKAISYADIGDMYGLSKWDMARINSKPPTTTLKPGQTAVVYQKVPTDNKVQ